MRTDASLFVIGTGLIGASFALAVRRAGAFSSIIGFDQDPAAAENARRTGVIDTVVTSIEAGAADAAATLICIPTGEIAAAVVRVAAAQTRPRPIFDVGSVKAPILEQLRLQGGIPSQFVPCHPMAGSEIQGARGAKADLFRDRRVFVTGHEHSDVAVLARVANWWRECGAQVVQTDAGSHDRAVALTSHLPHLVAFAYMAHAGDRADELGPFVGPGFQDFTRIAGSDERMWRHILLDNRAVVVEELDGLVARLLEIRRMLIERHASALEAVLRDGREGRRRYQDADG